MKKAFLLGVLLCIIGIINANAQKQQSLVTNEMAQKIAWTSQYGKRDFRSHMFGDFCRANEITSSLEYDRIMENITKHKDKVEKFFCLVINSWGEGDFGYAYFKNMDYTVAEYDIVLKIYNNWIEPYREQARLEAERKKKEEEEQKRIQAQRDRDTLAAWAERGKPIFRFFDENVTAPTFILDIEGFSDGQVITPNMQAKEYDERSKGKRNNNRKLSHHSRYSSVYYDETVTTNQSYTFIVDGDNRSLVRNTRYWLFVNGRDWIWQLDLDTTNRLFNYIQNIYIIEPSKYTFSGIDSAVVVPTYNALKIIEVRNTIHLNTGLSFTDFTKFEITVERDKKTGRWHIRQSDENKMRRWYNQPSYQSGLRTQDITWYLNVADVEHFINILNMQVEEELKSYGNKKCRLNIELLGGGEREYYINGYKSEDSNGLPFKTKILNIEKIK